MRVFKAIAIAAMSIAASACMTTPPNQNARLMRGPPIQDEVSPYEGALSCLASNLSPEQRQTSFSVGDFPDRTGRLNYVSDAGVGSFLSQGSADMLATSLHKAGVQVVDLSPGQRQTVDWIIGRIAGSNDPAGVRLMTPDVMINSAFTTLDFSPGEGIDVNIGGVRLSGREARMKLGLDGRAVVMPRSRLNQPTNMVISFDRTSKQLVGVEQSTGGTGIIGEGERSTFVAIDIGRRRTELVQNAQRYMIDRLAFNLITRMFGITQCDLARQRADQLADLQ